MDGGTNALTRRLGIEHPIVQGPFGGGLSTVELAATVSGLGGLGSYGAHHLQPDDIVRVVRALRAATDRPFAVNLWMSDHDAGGERLDGAAFERWWPAFEPYYRELGLAPPALPEAGRVGARHEEQIDALLEAAPPVFSFVFGIPSKAVLDACRARGMATIGAATTLAEALALDAAGVDAIVATGMEAGGHRPSFLASAEDSLTGTFALTQLVAPRVSVPVVAAGGIADRRGVAAALALGAHGAQVGTAFLACAESGAPPAHRARLLDGHARTTLTRAFSGRLARGIENRFTQAMASAQLAPFPIQGWFVAGLRAAALAADRTDLVALWSGQIAPNLKHRDARALMHALVVEPGGKEPAVATEEQGACS